MEGLVKGYVVGHGRGQVLATVGHSDIRGSAEPLPHDSEPVIEVPRTRSASRDRIEPVEGSRCSLSRSTMPHHRGQAAALGVTSCPVAQTKPASSRATAMTVLFTPMRATRLR